MHTKISVHKNLFPKRKTKVDVVRFFNFNNTYYGVKFDQQIFFILTCDLAGMTL